MYLKQHISVDCQLSIVDCLLMSDRNTPMIPGCSSTCNNMGTSDNATATTKNVSAGIEINDTVSAIADTGAVAFATTNSVATRVNKEVDYMFQNKFTTCPRAGQKRGEKCRSKCACLWTWKKAADFKPQLQEMQLAITKRTDETQTIMPVSSETIEKLRDLERTKKKNVIVPTSIVEKILLIQSYRGDSCGGTSKKKKLLGRWASDYELALSNCIRQLTTVRKTGNNGIGARYTFWTILPNQEFCISGLQTILGFSDYFRQKYFGKEGVTHDINIILNNHIFLAYFDAKVNGIIVRHIAQEKHRGKTDVVLDPEPQVKAILESKLLPQGLFNQQTL